MLRYKMVLAVFISVLYMGDSCRVGEVVQSAGHGPSVY